MPCAEDEIDMMVRDVMERIAWTEEFLDELPFEEGARHEVNTQLPAMMQNP